MPAYQYYDVRAVRFIKTTEQCPVKENQGADYICLGHFDMMHIDALSKRTCQPLVEIEKDWNVVREQTFNCPENCIYSLYIFMAVSPSDVLNVRNFWQESSTYTVVTRIHCDYPSNWSNEYKPFSNVLIAHCLKSSDKVHMKTTSGCITTLSVATNPQKSYFADVSIIFYDSLELGDTVAILKSSSLAAILEAVRHISQYPNVRDTYSYCGIKRELLQSEDSFIARSSVFLGATLDNITTRCSVRDNKNTTLFMQHLIAQNSPLFQQHYVTGTADLVIEWSSKTECDLMQIMWLLTQMSSKMFFCFNDVITRVGICQASSVGTISEHIKNTSIPKLDVQHSIIADTNHWLMEEGEKNKGILQGWKYTLLKLLRTLEAIHSNYVMDDLSELAIPSICAFLSRIKHIREKSGVDALFEFETEIVDFLRCWTELTNDIAQLESQLTQHPELVPIRYYIPATLLRFEAVFVQNCCKALSEPGGRKYVPMLIPTNIRYLTTTCPLDPKQTDYQGDCPLMVFIPFTDLYHPWNVALRIAHEISHYCEISARNRSMRHQVLKKCAANYIVKCWYSLFFSYLDNDGLYNNSLKYANALEGKIDSYIAELLPEYPTSGEWYLLESHEAINNAGAQIMIDPREREEYIFHLDKQYLFHNEASLNNLESLEFNSQFLAFQVNKLDLHMDALEYLCSESFADIAMILLLNCSFEDYFQCVYQEEFQCYLNSKASLDELRSDPYIMRQVVRLSLVIYAIQSVLGEDNQYWGTDAIKKGKAVQIAFAQDAIMMLEDVVNFLSRNQISTLLASAKFPDAEEFSTLQGYVSQCAKDISQALTSSSSSIADTINAVRKALSYVENDSFEWESIYRYIYAQP